MSKTTIGIIGCGNLGMMIADGIYKHLSTDYSLIGLFSRNVSKTYSLAKNLGCTACEKLEDLINLHPNIVIESSTVQALKEYALPTLRGGSDLIVLSAGAFADEIFYRDIESYAKVNNRKVYIASGAIGGLDIMQAATITGQIKSHITTSKSPYSLGIDIKDTPQKETIFSGSAKDAIASFPKNVNVAVALAMATSGIHNTAVDIICDPNIIHNKHMIQLNGDFGRIKIDISTTPSTDNPRSSAIAAASVIAKLKNLAAGISLC